jgi:hypothetical protein
MLGMGLPFQPSSKSNTGGITNTHLRDMDAPFSSSAGASSFERDWVSGNESIASDMMDEDLDEEAPDPSLGHNLPKSEMSELRDQMERPWQRQYRRIMRKKPRKIYLQITTGSGNDFDDTDKQRLSRKSCQFFEYFTLY